MTETQIRRVTQLVTPNGVTPTWVDDNGSTVVDLTGGGGGGTGGQRLNEVIVAANDANTNAKTNADYVCDGTDDDVQIQAAIDALSGASVPTGTHAGGRVRLTGRKFSIGAEIQLKSGIHVSGDGWRQTVVMPANSATLTACFILASVNVEATTLSDLLIDGNKTNSAATGGVNYDNTGGSFSISPDPVHKIMNVWIRECTLTGALIGSNTRNTRCAHLRITTCDQHGMSITGTDGTFIDIVCQACGTDDGVYTTYRGFNVTGANSKFYGCKASFTRGDGFLIDTQRCQGQIEAQDNYANGVHFGSNSSRCTFHITADSNGMFSTGSGLDAGVYVQGGYHSIIGESNTRNVAASFTNDAGLFGSEQQYGIRLGSVSGLNIDMVCQNNAVDAIVGSRAGTSGHKISITTPAQQSAVQVVNITGGPTGGTFTLTFPDSSETTGAISYDSTPATLAGNIQTALRALTGIGATGVNVAVGATNAQFNCTFADNLANQAVTAMTATPSLTGGSSPSAAIINRTIGNAGLTRESRLGNGRVILKAPEDAPTDSSIDTAAFGVYYDTGLDQLMARVRKPDATLKTIVIEQGSAIASTPNAIHQPGYLYASFDGGSGTGATVTQGTLFLARVDTDGLSSVTGVDLVVTSVTSVGTLSNCYLAVFDSSGSQLDVTSDQSASWNTTGLKQHSLSFTPGNGFVWVGILSNSTSSGPTFLRLNGTTQPAILGAANTNGTARVASNGTGRTSMPASITPGSNSLGQSLLWVGLR